MTIIQVEKVGPAFACTRESHEALKRDQHRWLHETDPEGEQVIGDVRLELRTCVRCGSTLAKEVRNPQDERQLIEDYEAKRLRSVAWATRTILEGR